MPEYNVAYESVNSRFSKLKWVSPQKFLDAAPSVEDHYSQRNYDDLKQKILSGHELDPLFLDISPECTILDHEGRHRALVAKDLGVEKVPVIFTCRKRERAKADFYLSGDYLPIEECRCPIMEE